MQSESAEVIVKKKIVPSMKPYFPEEDIQEVLRGCEEILRSGRLTLGKYTTQFEKEFANYVGVRHAIAANSGTSTLEMIYRSIEISGREVITPTNTHIATSNAVIFSGGAPVLADADEQTLCIDIEDAFSKVTPKTKAMVVVHVAGLILPEIDSVRRKCDELGIILIEDAAHAHGATIDGRKAGSLSKAGSFSFYPAKVITTIEGGMVTTDDDEIDRISRELRNHGSDPKTGLQVRLGYNWRMSEMHSLIGLVQLRRIHEILSGKRRVASVYHEALADSKLARPIKVPPNIEHSYYKFPVVISKSVDVDAVRNRMKEQYGIETGSIYYPPCHMMPVYRQRFGAKFGDLSTSEDVLRRTVAIPIYAQLEDEDARYVAESLLAAVKHSAS
jgi:perosamine synthetase